MAKKNNAPWAILLLGFIVVMVLQSGVFQFTSPTPIQMALYGAVGVGGTTTASGLTTVATSWQDWNFQLPDGSTQHFASDVYTIAFPWTLALVGPNQAPVYGDITHDIQFQIALPSGTDQILGAYFDSINIYDQFTVYLNNQIVGQYLANNYPTLYLTHSSYDDPNQLVQFQFRMLLGGSAPGPQPFTLPPLDLRSQIAALATQGLTTFNLKVAVSMQTTLFKMCVGPRHAPAPCQTIYSNTFPLIESNTVPLPTTLITTGISSGLTSGISSGFTVGLPTPTVSGTCTNDANGNNVCDFNEVVPTTSYNTPCGPYTCSVGSNGTSVHTTFTQINTPITAPNGCDLLFSSNQALDTWCKSFQWPNLPLWEWVLIAFGILILLYLIFRRRGTTIKVG